MRAVVLTKIPSPADALVVSTIPRPTLGKGEVLVKINVAGCNPIECKIREARGRRGCVG